MQRFFCGAAAYCPPLNCNSNGIVTVDSLAANGLTINGTNTASALNPGGTEKISNT